MKISSCFQRSCANVMSMGLVLIASGQVQGQRHLRRLRVAGSDVKTLDGAHGSLFTDVADEIDFGRFLSEMESLSMSMSMEGNPCLPPGVPPFEIEESVDIGDVCFDHGGGAWECGTSCYRVQDNGDNPLTTQSLATHFNLLTAS